MKKLFEADGRKIITYLRDHRVFELIDPETERRSFFDKEGRETSPPGRKTCEGERVFDATEDPTRCDELGNGYYSFTTHPVDYDPDGPFGLFGIKDQTGRVILDEKYWQIREIFNGLFPVQEIEGDWGCVDERGELVVPCVYDEPPLFNKYGLAYGNRTLIDRQGREIPGTEYNLPETYGEGDRYIPIILTAKEQDGPIEKTGTEERIVASIFDTKLRRYVVEGVPEGAIDVEFYDGEPEPILAAAKLLSVYDELRVLQDGFVAGRKGDRQDVYDCRTQRPCRDDSRSREK